MKDTFLHLAPPKNLGWGHGSRARMKKILLRRKNLIGWKGHHRVANRIGPSRPHPPKCRSYETGIVVLRKMGVLVLIRMNTGPASRKTFTDQCDQGFRDRRHQTGNEVTDELDLAGYLLQVPWAWVQSFHGRNGFMAAISGSFPLRRWILAAIGPSPMPNGPPGHPRGQRRPTAVGSRR